MEKGEGWCNPCKRIHELMGYAARARLAVNVLCDKVDNEYWRRRALGYQRSDRRETKGGD
jgi:hypothetical protein